MTKLAAALPDGHGLDAVRRHLLETPRRLTPISPCPSRVDTGPSTP